MLTRDQINDGAPALDLVSQEIWYSLIQLLPEYEKNPGRYPNLIAVLSALTAPTDARLIIKARKLNAILDYMEEQEIGFGTEMLKPNPKNGGVDYSKVRDVEQLTRFGLNTLYSLALTAPLFSLYSAVGLKASGSCTCGICGLAHRLTTRCPC